MNMAREKEANGKWYDTDGQLARWHVDVAVLEYDYAGVEGAATRPPESYRYIV